ncbi:cubilin-like [Argiope bruennichi]|uniref:cubilin-like n=1 Tax=Argiope bruennichi TaxID=94029 RepID=UPI0024952334|nr:cubilin-like [Argiope bruennichi]XP_055946471.1 cubilin-like [Argiope bruennichi]
MVGHVLTLTMDSFVLVHQTGSCNCPANWFGIHCTQQHNDCSTASHQELCEHGTCVDEKRTLLGQPKYRCICDAGWQAGSSGPACTVDIDECNGRCSTNSPVVCINLPGSFHCGPCPAGYTGSGHTCSDMNECEMNNGGCATQPYVQCINTIGSRTCGPCPSGYVGDGARCSFIGVCNVNRGGCHPLATCVENTAIVGTYRECRCPAGYIGNGEGPNGCTASLGMNCASNPCVSGTCHDIPGIHISKANEVTIKFKSNANNAGPGFSLTFETNAFLPYSSLPLIQRNPTEEVRTPIIYLN